MGAETAPRHGTSATFTNWRHFEPLQLTHLLEHALEAFYRDGFHGTTVRSLARSLGVTVPALYYHHESKEAVLVALLDSSTREVIERATAAAEEGGDDVAARFANVVEAVVLHMTHRSRLAALDSELRYVSVENRRNYAATRKQLELLLVSIVSEGTARGEFGAGDPRETVRALLGMCQSIARWYQPGGGLTPRHVAERYIDIALMTVGSRPRQYSPVGAAGGLS